MYPLARPETVVEKFEIRHAMTRDDDDDDDATWLELALAARDGDVDAIRRLVDAGARVDATRNFGSYEKTESPAPLAVAAAAGRVDAVRALVAAGADVSKRDAHSRDALEYASAYGECEVVRALLDAGADVNAQTTRDTPLKRAWTAC